MDPAAHPARLTPMRPTSLLLVAGLLGLAVAPFPPAPAMASCAAPSLTGVDALVLSPGERATVTGSSFMDGCQDSGSCSGVLACQSCDYGPEPAPSENVELVLRQRGHHWDLGTVDADTRGRATWNFAVPDGVRPGRARIVADGTQYETVRIR